MSQHEDDGIPVRSVCNRLHEQHQPCPLRIAHAYTMQPQALEKLTEADRRWMEKHKDFSVLDVVEDAIADIANADNADMV